MCWCSAANARGRCCFVYPVVGGAAATRVRWAALPDFTSLLTLFPNIPISLAMPMADGSRCWYPVESRGSMPGEKIRRRMLR